MSTLASRVVQLPDEGATAPLNSWDDRRSSVRRTLSELASLDQIRLKYGPAISLLDLSAGGAQIETASYRLRPGATVVVELATDSQTLTVPARVLRAHVSRILPTATYRAAVAFKCPLLLPQLTQAGKQSNRELDLVHELAKLNVTLRHLEESNGSRRGHVTDVGRGALAAAVAVLDSPSTGQSGTRCSYEISRLLRIINVGLGSGTAPRTMLDQLIEGVRRAVPAQVVRVLHPGALAGIPSDAICFDGASSDAACATRLVVEFPQGSRLDSWHFALLKAAAHLATAIAEIDQMTAVRDEATTAVTNRGLPVGWRRVVVRYLDGRLLKGFNADFAAAKGHVHVWMVPNGPDGSRITVPTGALKALFFVHDFEGDPGQVPDATTRADHGRPIEITFVDGEVLEGTTLNYSPEGPGFFVTPLDAKGNNLRVFVVSGAVRRVQFPTRVRAASSG